MEPSSSIITPVPAIATETMDSLPKRLNFSAFSTSTPFNPDRSSKVSRSSGSRSSSFRLSIPSGRNPFFDLESEEVNVEPNTEQDSRSEHEGSKYYYPGLSYLDAMTPVVAKNWRKGTAAAAGIYKTKDFRNDTVSRARKSIAPRRTTVVVPFRLRTAERGAVAQEAFQEKIKEEERRRQESFVFRAKPASVLYRPRFEAKPDREMRGPIRRGASFHFATADRAIQRQHFDEWVKQKNEEIELRKKRESDHKALLEQAHIWNWRQSLVPKARPVPVTRPFKIQRSRKPLTEPITPEFLRRRRSQLYVQEEPTMELTSRLPRAAQFRRRSSSVGDFRTDLDS